MTQQSDGSDKYIDWKHLWDRVEDVAAHAQKGIHFLEKIGQFLKERAIIEEEYAAKLKNLIKKSSALKKEHDDEQQYTYSTAYHSILEELSIVALQHEAVAEKIKDEIAPDITSKCQNFQSIRKQALNNYYKYNAILNGHRENVEKRRKNYEKAFKKAQDAQLEYDKAEKNMDISRAELEKLRENRNEKKKMCLEARETYRSFIELFNLAKNEHYHTKLPQLLESMRTVESVRILDTKKCMQKSVDADKNVMKFIEKCYATMTESIKKINSDKDNGLLAERLISGYYPPHDEVYVDLGDPKFYNYESLLEPHIKRGTIPSTSTSRTEINNSVHRKDSFTSKINNGIKSIFSRSNKVVAKDDFLSLPPHQRCRKLEIKIKQLEQDIGKAEKERDGLTKLRDGYQNLPKTGNFRDVEEHVNRCTREIAYLREKREKMKRYLLDVRNGITTPITSRTKDKTSNAHTVSTAFKEEEHFSYSDISFSSLGSSARGNGQIQSPNNGDMFTSFESPGRANDNSCSMQDSPTLTIHSITQPSNSSIPPAPPLPINGLSELRIDCTKKANPVHSNFSNLNESKTSLLEEIQNEVKVTRNSSVNVHSDLLKEIKAGVQLRHVESPKERTPISSHFHSSPHLQRTAYPSIMTSPISRPSPTISSLRLHSSITSPNTTHNASRDVLMNQIKRGPQLKRVDKIQIEKNRKHVNLQDQDGIAGALARAFENRRKHLCHSMDSEDDLGDYENVEDESWGK